MPPMASPGSCGPPGLSAFLARAAASSLAVAALRGSYAGRFLLITFHTGDLLVRAKAGLDHGEWLKMIEDELPFAANGNQADGHGGRHGCGRGRRREGVSWVRSGARRDERLAAGPSHPTRQPV
jgi:hypothetical protein